jgi:orotidine-5'-phosphate decarboxylase
MAELAVALDYPDARQAIDFGKKIQGLTPWIKVGLELFTASGPDIVAEFKGMGFKVFLDLKFMDIPNTVRGAVRSAARCGCDLLTLHAMGGEEMMRAARLGAGAGSPENPPLLVGVTVLTSMGPEDLPYETTTGLQDIVSVLAGRAHAAGLDGIVCSPLEARRIKDEFGPGFICVTPGIRPESSGDDQRRTATPAEAVKAGSDILVVGRPVTAASDPEKAILKILEQMG